MALNINNTTEIHYETLAKHTIPEKTVDTVTNQDETIYQNERAKKDWGYFLGVSKLNSAILMKAVWTVGKGYTTDTRTKVKLEVIDGDGKQTFKDILFSMVVNKQIFRDSFAEIIRDSETDEIINLKIIDPTNMQIVYDRNGRIKEYRQISPTTKDASPIVFKPEQIFHLSHNKLAGATHGISVPERCEKVILADDENFDVVQRVSKFQAVPFIIYKVKSDDQTKIDNLASKIRSSREGANDLMVPDDENLLSWEVVQVNPSSIIMDWRNSINDEYYRAVSMPKVIFGTSGSTESGGKMEVSGHETSFEHDQLEIEEQVKAQLGFIIDLYSPTSLMENLKTDESKDAQNALTMQPNDMMAGVGR